MDLVYTTGLFLTVLSLRVLVLAVLKVLRPESRYIRLFQPDSSLRGHFVLNSVHCRGRQRAVLPRPQLQLGSAWQRQPDGHLGWAEEAGGRFGNERRRPGEEGVLATGEDAPHQEAAERVHALHEGDAAQDRCRVHAQGVGGNQPDSWQKGRSW